MFEFLRARIRRKPVECDHLYFPITDQKGNPIGQECAFCHLFHSLEEVQRFYEQIDAEKNRNRENP